MKNSFSFALRTIIFALAAIFAASATWAATDRADQKTEPRAKQLYYESDEHAGHAGHAGHGDHCAQGGQQQALPERVGLKYKIILKDSDGDVREVTDKFKFSTGDRIRFVFESNIDGYLYIYHKGSSTRGTQLFPHPEINGGDNFVRRHTSYSIPARQRKNDWFRFDPKVGTEELYVFLSPKPIGSLQNFAAQAGGNELDEEGWNTVTASTSADDRGKRDIYYESGDSGAGAGQEEASTAYVVSDSPMLIHQLKLKHGH